MKTLYLCFFLFLLPSLLKAQSIAVHAPNVLYVKFTDGIGNDIFNNTLTTIPGEWKKAHQLPAATLERFRMDAAKKFNRKIPDPNSEYHFYVSDSSQLEAEKKQLEATPFVEYVLYVPILYNSAAPDYFPLQTYLDASDTGINAEAVWSTYNNRGSGIKLCDIEYAFNSNHTDLPAITVLGGTPQDAGFGENHATAVLGQLASLNNGIGTTGIASDGAFYFAGAYVNDLYDIAAAITTAMSELSEGDVILLEQQIPGPNWNFSSQFRLIPVEWYKPYYDAIVLAIGQGITVVEATGNGEQDLDSQDYSTDNGGHYPFLPGNDSGAIIVGVGAVSTDTPRARLWFSNFGSCVDVQGNG